MKTKFTIVVTSISSPNAALKSIALGCREYDHDFILVGDEKSPKKFKLDNCNFFGLEDQLNTGFKTAELCPLNSYSRKNIGYLLAIRNGTEIIIDTDDDNFPRKDFWNTRCLKHKSRFMTDHDWVNVYKYFTKSNETIWPRGLPLDMIHANSGIYDKIPYREIECPIQQGLADENPDVDAIYRLALPLPFTFKKNRELALGKNTWSPFNSQNTTWWKNAFPLMYLPSHCSFRMTDIWRSFVAQRIAWENDWGILYHGPTVYQERNEHNLMKDFADEVPGYLQNKEICSELKKLRLQPGLENLTKNLCICYEKLVQVGAIGEGEIPLLNAWLNDLKELKQLEQAAC